MTLPMSFRSKVWLCDDIYNEELFNHTQDTSDYGNYRDSVGGRVLTVVKTNIQDRSSSLSDVKVFSSEMIRVSIHLQIWSILK